MSRLDTSLAIPPRHHCQPPEITVWDTSPRTGDFPEPPRIISQVHDGTRWFCDCGTVLVVTWLQPGCNGGIAWPGHWAWRPETRRQRRQRLRAERRAARGRR